LAATVALTACGDDDDDACDCEIAGECYASGDTNPDNVCLICNPSQSSVSWSSNDYAACDDELYCNGADTCLSGECTEHAGDPCTTNPWDGCVEDSDSCEPSCTIVWTKGRAVAAGQARAGQRGLVRACRRQLRVLSEKLHVAVKFIFKCAAQPRRPRLRTMKNHRSRNYSWSLCCGGGG